MENKDGVIEEIIEDVETLDELDNLDETITESNLEYEVIQDDILEDVSEDNIEIVNDRLNINNETARTIIRPQDGKEVMSFESLVDMINDDKKEDYVIVEEKLGDNKKMILLVVFSILLAVDIVALILYIMM